MLSYSSALLSVALTAWCPGAMPTDTLPFLLPAILPAFISQKHTSFLCLVWTFNSFLAFKNFSSSAQKHAAHIHLSKPCAPILSLFSPEGGRVRPAVSLCLYKCWNIHMHTYLSPSLSWPISKKNIFLHFKVCYIYEGRRCPRAGQTQWLILKSDSHTPDATHRPKNWNETLRGGEEVCVLRKRNCGGCCRNRANYWRYLKDLLGREFIESNLHLYSWYVRKGEKTVEKMLQLGLLRGFQRLHTLNTRRQPARETCRSQSIRGTAEENISPQSHDCFFI